MSKMSSFEFDFGERKNRDCGAKRIFHRPGIRKLL